MAAVTIDAGARNAYYSAGNLGWSARSLFAYRTAIQQLEGSTASSFGNAAATTARAQSFTTAGAIDVATVRVAINKSASPTDDVSLQIWSDTGANLPNASIATADNVYNGAALSSTPSWLEFQFSTPVALSASTKYWLVPQRSGAVDATNFYQVRTVGGDLYASGGQSILNTGVWGAESATVDLAFQILTETPSALYAVTQSTEPALHVWKSTDDGASWSEQDASNNPAVTDATFPFDACDTRSGPYIGTARFTATNTLRAALFDMSTDTWGSDLGAADAVTNASNQRTIRIAIDNTFTTAAPGSQYISYSRQTDDADLGYVGRTTSTWGSDTLYLSLTSTEASLVSALVTDKAPVGFQQFFYYDCLNDDFSFRSLTSTTFGSQVDLDAAAADVETEHASATYQIYQASNVDTIIAAYIDDDGSIQERTASLEVTSASVTLGTEHAVGTATTTAGRQLSTCVYDGDGYVVVSVSGTGITYYIDAGLAGSWDGGTAWKTGLTDTPISQALSITGVGLAVVYTENGDAKIDWIDGGPASDVTINGSLATATALGRSGSLKVILSGSRGTASALANAGTVSIDYRASGSLATASALARVGSIKNTVTGSLSAASALANAGSLFNDVTGSRALATALANVGTYKAGNTMQGNHATASALGRAGSLTVRMPGSRATASAQGFAGGLFNDVTGSRATASALGRAGSLKNTVTGSLGSATGTANAGDIQVDITGSLATADGEAFTGDALTGYTVQGSLATASASAFAGTTQTSDDGDDDALRRRFFQVRTLPTGT
jgi:hypothetical protein